MRIGQVYFNVLHDMRPDIAEEIRGTQYDPFYDDTRLIKFFSKVIDIWGGEYGKE